MKVGIIIAVHNRSNYLEKTLWCLEKVEMPKGSMILLIDDASTDAKTIELCRDFKHYQAAVQLDIMPKNIGIKGVLLHGYSMLFNWGYDLVINFDSDCLIRPDAVSKLTEAYFCGLLTGFNCNTLNANGTERHKILYEESNLLVKQSVGGINFCVNKEAYNKYLKPALEAPIGNFDHMACINAGYAYSLKESVVQHIGFNSSMGHHEQPDVADDFYYWDLPSVTLIGADSNLTRLQEAANNCTKNIRFGDVKLLNPNLTSKEAYSEWCINEMYKYVDTSHMLVFQHDGYVHNWQAWDNDWLKYDYIGAPWYYDDGMEVGNGGFSLRSRALMEAASTLCKFHHPEDHHICRTYRVELEAMGFKFAPLEVAERFSFEGYLQPHKHLTDQFGKHGNRVLHQPRSERYVVNQFAGLGDILFLIPLIRELQNEGNKVLWPIIPQYLSIAEHFPDINFVNKDLYDLPYNDRGRPETQYGQMLPYRFATENMGRTLHQCMESKYHIFGHDHNIWRKLYWKRNKVREAKLIFLLGATGDFNLVNRFYGLNSAFAIEPIINNFYKVIEMTHMAEFSLIDWMGVIELAKEVHVANSSINYLIELSDITAPCYMYKRGLWNESGFEFTRQLWNNKCWRFVE